VNYRNQEHGNLGLIFQFYRVSASQKSTVLPTYLEYFGNQVRAVPETVLCGWSMY
jgi:hypothetical protein